MRNMQTVIYCACTYCHEGIHLEKNCWKKNQEEINLRFRKKEREKSKKDQGASQQLGWKQDLNEMTNQDILNDAIPREVVFEYLNNHLQEFNAWQ